MFCVVKGGKVKSPMRGRGCERLSLKEELIALGRIVGCVQLWWIKVR
jgi:hypothetical protein